MTTGPDRLEHPTNTKPYTLDILNAPQRLENLIKYL